MRVEDNNMSEMGTPEVTQSSASAEQPTPRSRSPRRYDDLERIITPVRVAALKQLSPITRSRSPHGPASTTAVEPPATGTPTIYYPSPKSSPQSMASTIPYSEHDIQHESSVVGSQEASSHGVQEKRERPSPISASPVHKLAKVGDSPPNDPGASSSGAQDNRRDGEIILPLREEDDEEEEDDKVLTSWLEELEKESSTANEVAECLLQAYGDVVPEELMQILACNDAEVEMQVEIGIEGQLALCHQLGSHTITGDQMVFVAHDHQDAFLHKGIERETGALSKDELMKNEPQVDAGKLKELKSLFDLGCYDRFPRKQARNLVDTRWVITWKYFEGKLIIKCRLTMRGFKDLDPVIETFAGTASRAGQRLVNSVVASEPEDRKSVV